VPPAQRGSGFDFYVLALGWSPSFCRLQDPDGRSSQCADNRDLGFMVHGLWPQFERGFPESCRSDQPQRVPGEIVDTIFDLMPSAGLVGHQWRKHGTCTGLTQREYFAVVREAFDRVALPAAFGAAGQSRLSPRQVEAAFMAANPGLSAAGVAVTCKGGMIEDVRICLSHDLGFRDCPGVDARSCNAASMSVPAAP